jgi:serine/threonine protein kinase
MDDWIIEKSIGSGASGDAFIVKEKKTDRRFVMKRILMAGVDQTTRRRVQQEVQTLQRVDHPNIVRYHTSFFVMQPPTCCLVMEKCETSLDKVIAAHRIAKQPFKQDVLVEWFAELLSAVAYIHAQGIVHRDIKPDNIFVSERKHLKLGDFGVCKSSLNATASSSIDRSSKGEDTSTTWAGTLMYLAPEVLGGAPQTELSDVWSLGVVFYELIALTRPFQAKNDNILALVNLITEQPAPRIDADVDSRLIALTQIMLEKDPLRRYPAQRILEKFIVVPESHPSHPRHAPAHSRLVQQNHGPDENIPAAAESLVSSAASGHSQTGFSDDDSQPSSTNDAAGLGIVGRGVGRGDWSSYNPTGAKPGSPKKLVPTSQPSPQPKSNGTPSQKPTDRVTPTTAAPERSLPLGNVLSTPPTRQTPNSLVAQSPNSAFVQQQTDRNGGKSIPRGKMSPAAIPLALGSGGIPSSSPKYSPPQRPGAKKPIGVVAGPGTPVANDQSPPARSGQQKVPVQGDPAPQSPFVTSETSKGSFLSTSFSSASGRKPVPGDVLSPEEHSASLQRIKAAKSKVNVAELREKMKQQSKQTSPPHTFTNEDGVEVYLPRPVLAAAAARHIDPNPIGDAGVGWSRPDSPTNQATTGSPQGSPSTAKKVGGPSTSPSTKLSPRRAHSPHSPKTTASARPPLAAVFEEVYRQHRDTITLGELDDLICLVNRVKIERFGFS